MNLAEKITELEKKLIDLEKRSFSKLEDIILKADFKILCFYGLADGNANLTHAFDDTLIQNKTILIKAVKIFPYYKDATVDVEFSDGTTETIAAGVRVNRVFDTYSGAAAARFDLLVNSAPVIFNQGTNFNLLPSDYEFDNAYKLIKNVNTIDVNCYFEQADPSDSATTNPNVKVYLECYLY